MLRELHSSLTQHPGLSFWSLDQVLPSRAMSWADIEQEMVEQQKLLLVVEGKVCDITEFVHQHPGGKAFIQVFIGRDATAAFRGGTGVYNHSNTARDFVERLQVAVLKREIQ